MEEPSAQMPLLNALTEQRKAKLASLREKGIAGLSLLPLIFLLGFVLTAHGAEAPGKISRKLELIPACPTLVSAANRDHIPIEGMDAWSGTNTLRPGDSATVLVTFIQGKKQTQWLLYLEAATPDPAKATNKPSTFVVGSAFGPPIKFKSRPFPVKLRMFGPFAAAGLAKQPKANETDAQFSVNEDFLALGLDESAALLHRWSKVTNFNKGLTSKAMLAMNPTPAEQRTLSATFPALISYFEIVQHTEGLEDLLRKLIELPSLWSIIKHRGVQMNLTFGDGLLPSPANAADWNLKPSTPAYYFPWLLRLNGEPALKITLVTTSPRSPLRICGGVVGVLAEKIGDEETYMTLRLVSAKGKRELK
jgi:hypothetical protein